jgi:hypothetical protein
MCYSEAQATSESQDPFADDRYFSGGLSGLSAQLRAVGSCDGSWSQTVQT